MFTSNNQIQYDALYEEDPQQLDSFFSLKGLFSGNHSAVPMGVRVITYGIAILFVFTGVAFTLSTILQSITQGFGFGPRTLMLIAAGVIAVFCGLKITQGVVIFWMRKLSRAEDYNSFFSNSEIADNCTYYQQAPASLTSVVFDSLRPLFSVVEAIHNAISFQNEYQQILMGELFSTRRSTGSPSGVIVSEGYVLFLKGEHGSKRGAITKAEEISQWFQNERGLSIEEIIPLRGVQLYLISTGVVLLLPQKLKGPATAYLLFKLFQRSFYSQWYVDIALIPEINFESFLSVDRVLYKGVAVGDDPFFLSNIKTDDDHLNTLLKEYPENGICSIDDECYLRIENRIVRAITITKNYWEKREPKAVAFLQEQLGQPDFVYDNYLLMDDYTDNEEYYQYKRRGMEVTMSVNTGTVSEVTFKYFK